MEKKKKRAILIKHLEGIETQLLLAQVEKRAIDSMVMATTKPNDQLTSTVSGLKRQLDTLAIRIRKTNEMIDENK